MVLGLSFSSYKQIKCHGYPSDKTEYPDKELPSIMEGFSEIWIGEGHFGIMHGVLKPDFTGSGNETNAERTIGLVHTNHEGSVICCRIHRVALQHFGQADGGNVGKAGDGKHCVDGVRFRLYQCRTQCHRLSDVPLGALLRAAPAHHNEGTGEKQYFQGGFHVTVSLVPKRTF